MNKHNNPGWHNKIAGWLVIPSFGLLLSPIVLIYGIAISLQQLQQSTSGTNALTVDVIVQAALLLYFLVVLYNFFGLKRITKILAIVAFFTSIAYLVFLRLLTGTDPSNRTATASFLIAVIANLGWILYFSRSERVRQTFTR